MTLTASGAIISGLSAGVTDVAAARLAVASPTTGVGTSATPFKTAVATFAANVGAGGVFDTNTAATLTLGTVGSVVGVTSTGGGSISVVNTGNLTTTVPVNTTANGNITLTATTGA